MNINNITFIYDTGADICFLRAGKSIRELTIKGTTERNGETNGTWFQIDELTKHWISFKKDKFRANKWEVFYKCISDEQIIYYRRLFLGVEGILIFSFSEKDEWVKNEISGKWQSKHDNKQ